EHAVGAEWPGLADMARAVEDVGIGVRRLAGPARHVPFPADRSLGDRMGGLGHVHIGEDVDQLARLGGHAPLHALEPLEVAAGALHRHQTALARQVQCEAAASSSALCIRYRTARALSSWSLVIAMPVCARTISRTSPSEKPSAARMALVARSTWTLTAVSPAPEYPVIVPSLS